MLVIVYSDHGTQPEQRCFFIARMIIIHDDVIEWKCIPRYWLFVWGIYRSPVNSPLKGQGRRALMLSLICAWVSGWLNNIEAGELKGHLAHYDITVM